MNPRFVSAENADKKSIFSNSNLDSAIGLDDLSPNNRHHREIGFEHSMVGESHEMRAAYALLARAAGADSSILIQGESGTGKELAARALHRNSQRCHQPFVALNCAAIPEGLLESGLFGHERGAFTGAHSLQKGRLEIADGGTIFLDEIGELALGMQVKLLRFLQERSFERVGGAKSISVDVRLISATNRDLLAEMKRGRFRQDLFYRLNVLSVTMPSLRERRSDIPLLAEYFVVKHEKKVKIRGRRISPSAIEALMGYDWPGNVRELENVIERAVILSASLNVELQDLPIPIQQAQAQTRVRPHYRDAVSDLKKKLILKAIEDAEGSFTRAAQILGIHANYLHRLIRNLGLRRSICGLQMTHREYRGEENHD